MRYTGILETIRIRKAGFPERMTFREFVERYKTFSFKVTDSLKHDEATCRELLRRAQVVTIFNVARAVYADVVFLTPSHADFRASKIDPGWKIGKTKVFLKLHQRDQLETAFSRIEKKVIILQACRICVNGRNCR